MRLAVRTTSRKVRAYLANWKDYVWVGGLGGLLHGVMMWAVYSLNNLSLQDIIGKVLLATVLGAVFGYLIYLILKSQLTLASAFGIGLLSTLLFNFVMSMNLSVALWGGIESGFLTAIVYVTYTRIQRTRVNWV